MRQYSGELVLKEDHITACEEHVILKVVDIPSLFTIWVADKDAFTAASSKLVGVTGTSLSITEATKHSQHVVVRRSAVE